MARAWGLRVCWGLLLLLRCLTAPRSPHLLLHQRASWRGLAAGVAAAGWGRSRRGRLRLLCPHHLEAAGVAVVVVVVAVCAGVGPHLLSLLLLRRLWLRCLLQRCSLWVTGAGWRHQTAVLLLQAAAMGRARRRCLRRPSTWGMLMVVVMVVVSRVRRGQCRAHL